MRLGKNVVCGLLLALLALTAHAGVGEWTWDKATDGVLNDEGLSTHSVEDGQGNSLVLFCSEIRPAFAALFIKEGDGDAASYESYESPRPPNTFEHITLSFVLDGKAYEDPFNPFCYQCEEVFRQSFWPALRKAKTLAVTVLDEEYSFSAKGLSQLLLPLNDPANACLTTSHALALASQSPVRKPVSDALPAGFTLRAVINDPDGYTNMRSQKSAKSQIVARVAKGEIFFTYQQQGNWWQVRTQNGKVGYMHVSRIVLRD